MRASLLENRVKLAPTEEDRGRNRVRLTFRRSTTTARRLSTTSTSTITDGELMVLVGPSGCGKTTALRMLAGLEEITDGEIRIGERVVNDLTPKDRDIAMVFQSYALYPHMTVEQNLAFGLKLRQAAEAGDQRARAARGEDPPDRGVPEAQAARALGRPAPARRDGPRDRPRAAGVPDGRAALEPRREAARARCAPRSTSSSAASASTTIYVTHDQVEAMTMGDRVAVMQRGPPAAGRHAAGALRPARQRVRRRASSARRRSTSSRRELEQSERLSSRSGFGDYKLAVDDQLARNRSGARRLRRPDGHARHPPRGLRGREPRVGRAGRPADRRPSADLTEPLGSEVLVYFSVEATGIISSAVTADAAEGDADVYFGGGDGRRLRA